MATSPSLFLNQINTTKTSKTQTLANIYRFKNYNYK